MLTFFLLVGRYLAHRARAAARSAAAELAALEVRMATRLGRRRQRARPCRSTRFAPATSSPSPPASASPSTAPSSPAAPRSTPSLLTGETMPAAVAPGAAVRAGMANLSGPIEVRADALGEDTLLQQITRLIETAERSRTRYATLAERAARLYGPMVFALAGARLPRSGASGPTTGGARPTSPRRC